MTAAVPCGVDQDYHDCVNQLGQDHPDLAQEFSSFRGLEDLLDWMQRRNFPTGSVDLIGMDEFCYDFLLDWKANERWLVFGVT